MTPVFTAEDHVFFKENGYVILKNAVPQNNLDAVLSAIEEYTGIDLNNPDAWYHGTHPPHGNGMLELYQHQALWDNRQCPRIHQGFSELWGTEKLWVSMDRVNLKPPMHPEHPENDHTGFIHWDVDTSERPAFYLQGVLCLTDTTADMGGFQCVPEIFKNWDTWVKNAPVDRDPRKPEIKGEKIVPIPGNAGDLIIWSTLLAHGNGQNVGNRPRLAQYINLSAAPHGELTPAQEAKRLQRVSCWRNRTPPNEPWAHGDPREWEQKNGTTAVLTPLGRKLLGEDLWD